MSTNTAPHTPAAVRNADGLAVIGRTLHDLRGIRFDDGEGGATPAAPAPAAPTQHQRSTSGLPGPAVRANAQPAQPTGDPVPGAAPSGTPTPSTDPAPAPASTPTPGQQYTPEQTEQYVKGVREEAKANRERAEAAEAARDAALARQQDILKAVGLQMNADGTIAPYVASVPTEQAQAQTAAVATDRDNTARENLVLRVSPSLTADADKMLDSRSFTDQLHKLKADDRAGAEALVREWVQKHPEHGLAPLPAAASAQTQHSGGAPVNGRKSREEALKARMSTRKTA